MISDVCFLLLPDAVLVQTVQFIVISLRLGGPAVQVLEAFPGTDTLLGRLLWNIQLATKRQAAFGAVIHKQHRVTVVALEEQEESESLLGTD